MSTSSNTTAEKKAEKTAARKAEMEALHGHLAEQVAELRTTEGWLRYLAFAQAFHHYSLNNMLLILAQREDATHVAGYRVWQSLGRQVRKGQTGIRILAPASRKTTDEDPQTGESITTRRTFFLPVSVFDLSQTDPIDGAEEDAAQVPQNPAQLLTGQDPDAVYDRVADYLTASGVTLSREALGGHVNGYTRTTEEGAPAVVVAEDLPPAQAAKTILHEAAHIALGHLQDDIEQYRAHRGRYEVEAESVAYVLAALAGLDTSAYSVGYVAGWAQSAEEDVIETTAAHVLTTVHTLADALSIGHDTLQAAVA